MPRRSSHAPLHDAYLPDVRPAGPRPDFYVVSLEKQTMISVHFLSGGRRKRIRLPYGALGYAFFTDPDTIIIPWGSVELQCKFVPPDSTAARELEAEFIRREQARVREGGEAGTGALENTPLPDNDWEPPDDGGEERIYQEPEEGQEDMPRSVTVRSEAPSAAPPSDLQADDPTNPGSTTAEGTPGDANDEEPESAVVRAELLAAQANPVVTLAPSPTDAPPSAHEPEPSVFIPDVPEFPGQNVRKFLDLLQNWMIRGLFSLPDSGMTVRVFKQPASPDQPPVEM